MKEYIEYPKWIYKKGEGKIVETEEERMMFPDWTDSQSAEVEPVNAEEQTEEQVENKPRRGRPPKK